MVQFRGANLRDVVSRPAVTGKPIYATTENAFRGDTRKRIEQLNDFFQAKASNQAGSSAPVPSVRGELWADTSTAGAVALYLEPDGEGYDDNVATRLTAQTISFKGPGTSQTFKPGGAIDVNTTAAFEAQMTYTMPSGTLSSNGQAIGSIIAATSAGGVGPMSLSFNGNSAVATSGDALATASILKTLTVRTGTTSVKVFGFRKNSSDATGDGDLVEGAGSETVTLSSNVLIEMGATGTDDTNQFMLTRFLP